MADILIRNATLVTPGEGGVVERGYLAIAGNRIESLGQGDPAQHVTAPTQLDCEGMVVIPGLVNAHTHLAMTLFRGYADDLNLKTWLEDRIWPLEMKLSEDDVYWGSLLGVVEMLLGGTTTFNDMYHHFSATARAAVDGGIRACPSGVLLGFLPTAEDDLRKAIRFVDEWDGAGNGRIRAMFGPHALYTCPEYLMEKVVDAALERRLRVHIHVSETAAEVEDSLRDFGLTPVQRMEKLGVLQAGTLAAHCVHLRPQDFELLGEYEAGVSHNPISNLKLAAGFAPVPEMLAHKVVVGLGTDGAASNNSLDMFQAMKVCALLHKAVTGDPTAVNAHQVLEMATLGSAKALGLGDEIGSLEVGKKADIVVVDFTGPHLAPVHNVVSHLVYSARASDVRHVIVDGRLLVRDGKLTHLDAQGIIREATRRAKALIGG